MSGAGGLRRLPRGRFFGGWTKLLVASGMSCASRGSSSLLPHQYLLQEALPPHPDQGERPVLKHLGQRIEGHALYTLARTMQHRD